jgi:hypothetical protein
LKLSLCLFRRSKVVGNRNSAHTLLPLLSFPLQVLKLRNEKAALLGFENFAELSMASKVRHQATLQAAQAAADAAGRAWGGKGGVMRGVPGCRACD